jgi:hypothetical protein
MSPSAVGHAVRIVEERLGMPLFRAYDAQRSADGGWDRIVYRSAFRKARGVDAGIPQDAWRQLQAAHAIPYLAFPQSGDWALR